MNLLRACGWVMVSLLAGGLFTSCRKGDDRVVEELQEAGYAMTAEDWMRACEAGDVLVVRRYLEAGFDVATVDGDGNSGAHAAAGAGAEDVFGLLLNRGLDIDVRGAAERTPLMAAVLGDEAGMVRWLLRQGADASLRDAEGLSPMMLAVRHGRRAAVEELAVQSRDQLDDALLLSALVGHADLIDVLTNYGASVFARMPDGRTALMMAAENGHVDAVELLMDLGSSRFSTSDDGRTAMDFAAQAGFPEVQMILERSSREVAMRLDGEEDLIQQMTGFVDLAAGGATTRDADGDSQVVHEPTVLLADAVVSPAVVSPEGVVGDAAVVEANVASGAGSATGASVVTGEGSGDASAAVASGSAGPPLVMRHYQQRELPIRVMRVVGDGAILELSQNEIDEVRVLPGEMIPDTTVEVVRVGTRMEAGKLNDGEPMEVAYVEVRDARGGATRTWLAGEPAATHEPAALVEDAATGRRYLALPGQRFTSEDGRAFVVADVRPNQMVIVEETTGAAHTLPLRGPRG